MKALRSSCFLLSFLLCAAASAQSRPNQAATFFDNSSWHLFKIAVSGNDHLYTGKMTYLVDFVRKNKKRHSIRISRGMKNSADYCLILVPSQYSFDIRKKTYNIFLNHHYIFPDKCNISTRDYQIFGEAFNAKGIFELKGDTLVMREGDGRSALYLKRVHAIEKPSVK